MNVDYFMSAFLFERSDSCEQMCFEKYFEAFETTPLIFSAVNYSQNSNLSRFTNLIKIKTLSEFSSFLKSI